MSNFCPKTCPVKGYEPTDLGTHKMRDTACPDLDEWRDCWADMRIAVGGKKSVDKHARGRDWLELPEHTQYQLMLRDPLSRKMAEQSACDYYHRAPYDESVRIAIAITSGAVFRIETEYEGLDGNGFTVNDLDNAETSLVTWRAAEKYLLKERLTTGLTASYVFMREGDAPTVKHYCAENILSLGYCDMGRLDYGLFREYVKEESENRFERHKTKEVYRELSIEDGIFIERVWEADSKDSEEFEASDDVAVVVRQENLEEIPVVIIGGLENPPFEALFEKTRELYQISAQIEYRAFKMAHPTLHINYEDTPSLSYVCPLGEDRGAHVVDNTPDPEMINDEPPAIVPGLALETQKTKVDYLYDTGVGVDFLERRLERAKEDLEKLGGHYGVSSTASNVAEGTERMRKGREMAFVTNFVLEVSEGLTQIARWLAFFGGITDNGRLGEIEVALNTQLIEEGPAFTLSDVRDLFVSGTIDSVIAIRLLRVLLPSEIFEDGMTDEEIVNRMEAAQFSDFIPNSETTQE